jgi:chaperonin GroEL
MSKRIYLKDSQDKLLEGINLLADAVKSTLGPSGKTVIIANGEKEPFATKDGVTVAMEINHEDPVMNAAIQLVKKVASKMDFDSGDGTTTATVLCRELIALGMMFKKTEGFDEHRFKIVIQEELGYVIEQVFKNSVEIKLEDIGKVALTSANNDVEIATLFQDAFNNSKEDGYINIVETTKGYSYVDIIKGYVVELGYMDRKYANNPRTNFFEAKRCRVVLYDNEFNDKREMIKLIERASKADPLPLLIFAKEYSKEVVNVVDYNNMDRIGNRICLIKNPLRNDEYSTLVSDIANYTGSTPIKHFDEYDAEFGEAHNVIIKQGYSILGENVGTQNDLLNDYLFLLEQASKEEASAYHAGEMKKRVDRMRNGVTTFYVGGNSDVEITEKKHRVEDAYKACNAALKGRVIMGGGQSLVVLSKSLKSCNDYQRVFYQAIRQPFVDILKNSLHKSEDIMQIEGNLSFEKGYNAKSRCPENLYESGIVDPVTVVVNGLTNAVSIAMTILSTECLIVETHNN